MSLSRRFVLGLSVLLCLVGPASAMAETVEAPDLSARVQAMVDGRNVPGLAVLTLKDGQTQEGVAGVRDLKTQTPAQIGDVWHLGSDGKAISATVIARLVEKGILSWEAPLEALLPEMAQRMHPTYRQATLEDLLSHRSGLPDHIGMEGVLAFFSDTRPVMEQRRAYIEVALAQAPEAEPRTARHYSNNGYVVAAVVAERVTGKSFEDLTFDEVLKPLGMTTAGFGATREGQPLGHEGGVPLTGLMADNPPVLAPAGELHMSLGDWARFVQDQLVGEIGDGQLLSAQTYQRLHQSQGDSGSAMGWGVRGDFGGVQGRIMTHVGSNGYWNAMVVARVDRPAAILVVANGGDDTEAAPLNLAVLRSLAAETFGD